MQILCCRRICESLPGCCQEHEWFKPCPEHTFFVERFLFVVVLTCLVFALPSAVYTQEYKEEYTLNKKVFFFFLGKLFRVLSSNFRTLEL